MMKSLRPEELVRVTVTLWTIWYARRKAVHENIYQSPLSTHQFVSNFVANLELVKPQGRAWPEAHGSPVRWIPPPIGLMKINVDTALAKSLGVVAAAAVARNAVGKFLGASAVVMEGLLEPNTVEAIACKEGLALASDLVLRDFRLSCDNAEVIRSIWERTMGSYGYIVKEIRARSHDFNFVDFVHEGR